jgi:glycogen debranching enzyme
MLLVDGRGECGDSGEPGTGFYFRETRYLHTLRLELDGERPWICERTSVSPRELAFAYIYPELVTFSGGGSGEGGEEETVSVHGLVHRSLDIRVSYEVRLTSLHATVIVANRARRASTVELAWVVAADFTDLLEVVEKTRRECAPVRTRATGGELELSYDSTVLPYRTLLRVVGDGAWVAESGRLVARLTLEPQQVAHAVLLVEPRDYAGMPDAESIEQREVRWRTWRDGLARVEAPGSASIEATVAAGIRDVASLPLLAGAPDEWLTCQAGVPLYPALFGRDALTGAWQSAMLDRGDLLDATLTRLGRLQGTRDDPERDEQPGRIVQQVRSGPLSRRGVFPFSRYYGDFASPLMYVIALGHLYAWTGERDGLARHWDVARRVLDWAREQGDADGDGYLEYETRSANGPKNQGWKDSGRAVVYPDGRPVPSPLGTCELQGYWFAAQQLMAVMSYAMGQRDDARAHWRSAQGLKERFNRDWWVEEDGFFALAMDAEKRLVRDIASNAGHCLATGIIDGAHLEPVVERLFASDMFSGWGIRTLSSLDRSYNPLDYHLGSIWAVENATIAFGLRRFGFDARALELVRAQLDLAALYPDHRVPECVGGYGRDERPAPGAYPRANAPQLWNASAMPLLVHTLLGLQPVGPLDLLVIDPVLPPWLPEVIVRDLRLAGATATLRFWRDRAGASHGEIVERRGTLHLVKQPPLEAVGIGIRDRLSAFVDGVMHR